MNTTEFSLDEVTSKLFEDIEQQMKAEQQRAAQQAAAPFMEQIRGILTLEIRRNALEGNWTISPDKKRLIRTDTPAQEPNIAQKNNRKKRS